MGVVLVENKKEMPMGLAFQMSMNEQAMEHFAKMTEEEKDQVLDKARQVTNKSQMQGIVEDLGKAK